MISFSLPRRLIRDLSEVSKMKITRAESETMYPTTVTLRMFTLNTSTKIEWTNFMNLF